MSKSQSLKLFEGEIDQARLKPNPQPQRTPSKPRGLGREAGQLWDKLVPQLEALNLATAIDEAQLTGLCKWWGLYARAEKDFQDTTEPIGSTGRQRALNELDKTWNNFRRAAQSFGLSPDARTGIHVETPAATSGLDELKL